MKGDKESKSVIQQERERDGCMDALMDGWKD